MSFARNGSGNDMVSIRYPDQCWPSVNQTTKNHMTLEQENRDIFQENFYENFDSK